MSNLFLKFLFYNHNINMVINKNLNFIENLNINNNINIVKKVFKEEKRKKILE